MNYENGTQSKLNGEMVIIAVMAQGLLLIEPDTLVIGNIV
jgi:hypothetical protein